MSLKGNSDTFKCRLLRRVAAPCSHIEQGFILFSIFKCHYYLAFEKKILDVEQEAEKNLFNK
jgi:hypothetical protein